MKTLVMLVAFGWFHQASVTWLTSMEEARKLAASENKFILLNFSGSDWCGPCIRMHQDIFESATFEEFAGEKLVLVNADFPRLRKHQLSREQQALNNKMADQYNPTGIFPLTLLLRSDGTIVRKWEGLPDLSAEAFKEELKTAIVNEMQ